MIPSSRWNCPTALWGWSTCQAWSSVGLPSSSRSKRLQYLFPIPFAKDIEIHCNTVIQCITVILHQVGKISYSGEAGAAADESFSTSTGIFLHPNVIWFQSNIHPEWNHQPCSWQWGGSVWRMSPFWRTSSSLATIHILQGLPCTQAGTKSSQHIQINSDLSSFKLVFSGLRLYLPMLTEHETLSAKDKRRRKKRKKCDRQKSRRRGRWEKRRRWTCPYSLPLCPASKKLCSNSQKWIRWTKCPIRFCQQRNHMLVVKVNWNQEKRVQTNSLDRDGLVGLWSSLSSYNDFSIQVWSSKSGWWGWGWTRPTPSSHLPSPGVPFHPP